MTIFVYLPPTSLPFVLSHVTGITSELVSTVVSCVSAGLSMDQIEQMVKQRYMNAYTDRRRQYEKAKELFLKGSPNAVEEVLQLPLEPVKDYEGPSDNIISDCFLYDFRKNIFIIFV